MVLFFIVNSKPVFQEQPEEYKHVSVNVLIV